MFEVIRALFAADVICLTRTVIGGVALVFNLLLSAKERNSGKAITVAVLVSFLFVDVNAGPLFEGNSIYAFRIMSDFALVLVLHIKACRETAIIMMLSLCSVVINIFGFSFELLNPLADLEKLDLVIDSALMAVFYSMLAVLWHKGLANGIYSYINNLSIVRCYCEDHLKINTERAKK